MALTAPRLAAALAGLAAAPALADPVACSFTEECYMTLACSTAAYELSFDAEAGTASDITGDFELLASNEAGTSHVLSGHSGFQLLSIGPATAILTVHIGAGPAQVTYYGECGE